MRIVPLCGIGECIDNHSPSITENHCYDDLSGVRTASRVLSVRYMSRHRCRPAVYGAAWTLQEIAYDDTCCCNSGLRPHSPKFQPYALGYVTWLDPPKPSPNSIFLFPLLRRRRLLGLP